MLLVVMSAAFLPLLASCEKTNHENIDKWMLTEKGPGKLKDALGDSDLDADLRAHAGQNLIRMDEGEAVIHILENIPAEKRDPMLAKLVARLWADARVDGEMTMPSPSQAAAKDALYDLRRFAKDELRKTIDGYLVDWFTGGYYAARARQGRVRGAAVMRAIGPPAATKLLRSAKSLLVSKKYKLEEPLLVGLGATGSPEAVGFIIDLLTIKHNDKDLPKRALDSLYVAFVDNQKLFEVADPNALVPHLDRLVKLAQDESQSARTINDAIRLIRITGPSHCIKPLIELITYPHEDPSFLRVSANAAVLCGRAQGLLPVADALPRKRGYSKAELDGTIVEPAAALEDIESVAKQARAMLESESWVARLLGVELLGRLARKESATSDAAAVRKLEDDRTVLKGWWGDQSDVPRRQRKKPPRLGERAQEVADQLDQLPKSS